MVTSVDNTTETGIMETEEEFEMITQKEEEKKLATKTNALLEKIEQDGPAALMGTPELFGYYADVEGHIVLYSEDTGYTEYLDGTPKTIKFILENPSTEIINFTPIIAGYNGFGELIYYTDLTQRNVAPQTQLTLSALNYSFPLECSYIKFLMIDLNTMKPYAFAKAVYKGGDMYGETQGAAARITDITKPINGYMNGSNDFDTFEIAITEPGNYKFECTCTGQSPNLALFDSGGNTYGIMQRDSIKPGYLPKDDYYLFVYSAKGGHYVVTVTNLDTGNSIPVVTPKIRTDSSFIYVNNPEYITCYDIVDDNKSEKTKIFEQKIFPERIHIIRL